MHAQSTPHEHLARYGTSMKVQVDVRVDAGDKNYYNFAFARHLTTNFIVFKIENHLQAKNAYELWTYGRFLRPNT